MGLTFDVTTVTLPHMKRMTAGEKLKLLREGNDMSQANCAEAVGCSRWAISLYEKMLRKPGPRVSWELYLLTKQWGSAIEPPEWER